MPFEKLPDILGIAHPNLIGKLEKEIGTLRSGGIRVGRIQYRESRDPTSFFIYFVDYYIDKEKIETYSPLQDKIGTESLLIEKLNKGHQFRICYLVWQSWWIKNDVTIATGLNFRCKEEAVNSTLVEIYRITDYLGEPFFEDLKMIKWNIQNTTKNCILLLPKILSKSYYSFHLLVGESSFFEKSEVWKDGA